MRKLLSGRKINIQPQDLTLKSENALLLTTRNQVVLHGTNKSFQDVHLNAKLC